MSSIKFVNYKSIDKVLEETITKAPQIVSKTLDRVAQRLVELINQYAPKKSGKYAASWAVGTKTERKITVETPFGLLYIILEFQGRAPGKITAKNAKALHFEIDGVGVFAVSVQHPGFDPMPHARPALRDAMREMMSIIISILKQEIILFKV